MSDARQAPDSLLFEKREPGFNFSLHMGDATIVQADGIAGITSGGVPG